MPGLLPGLVLLTRILLPAWLVMLGLVVLGRVVLGRVVLPGRLLGYVRLVLAGCYGFAFSACSPSSQIR